jgi:hypothetical protein
MGPPIARPSSMTGPSTAGPSSSESKVIEEKPDWAWDVAGTWHMESPMLVELLKLAEGAPFTVNIGVTNNPKHTNVGCQIWAELEFAHKLFGAMKISPDNRDPYSWERPRETIKEFENDRMLSTGRWPGPSPKGFQTCRMRWRGGDSRAHLLSRHGIQDADQYETELKFYMNEHGSLEMSIVFLYRFQYYVLKGNKFRDAEPYKISDPTIRTRWDHYRPPAPLPWGERLIVPAEYAHLCEDSHLYEDDED